jgi:glyoxylase-like metal-dependent hydrolase (beta-lactamase superfamily II)
MIHAIPPTPSSDHFEIQKLAEGVYAAVAREFGAAFSNSGIIDLGGLTIVFDTFETPKAAEDLRAVAETLTGRAADYVINSHIHADHWFGNQAFSGKSTIISTHKTRDLMPAYLEDLKTLKQNPSDLNTSLQENLRLLDKEADPKKRAAIEGYVARLKHSLESLPTLELILPNQTFGSKVVFLDPKGQPSCWRWATAIPVETAFWPFPKKKLPSWETWRSSSASLTWKTAILPPGRMSSKKSANPTWRPLFRVMGR